MIVFLLTALLEPPASNREPAPVDSGTLALTPITDITTDQIGQFAVPYRSGQTQSRVAVQPFLLQVAALRQGYEAIAFIRTTSFREIADHIKSGLGDLRCCVVPLFVDNLTNLAGLQVSVLI